MFRTGNRELEYHLLEAVNHLMLLALPASYHKMPEKVKDRFASLKGKLDEDEEEGSEEEEDEEMIVEIEGVWLRLRKT